jgi:hypothetical protein
VRAESSADFVLTIKDDPISLNANDASNRLSTSYAYVWNSVKEGGKLTKIVLLPKGKGTAVSTIKEEKKLVKSESRSRKEIAREKSPRPEPFKFEFDPSEFMEDGK